jgi:hypothetical protein
MALHVSESNIRGTIGDQAFSRFVVLMQGTVVQWVDALRNPQRDPPSAEFLSELRELGIDPQSLSWGPMTFLPYRAEYVVGEIMKRPPRAVLEIGAGLSTLLFSALGARYGFPVFSIENFKGSVSYVQHLFSKARGNMAANLQLCSFVRRRYSDGQPYRWYGADLAEARTKFDLVFIDGPMKTLVGRNGALPEVAPYLATDNRIFLDDTNLDHGKFCIRQWKEQFPLLEVREDCFGVARMHLPMPDDAR